MCIIIEFCKIEEPVKRVYYLKFFQKHNLTDLPINFAIEKETSILLDLAAKEGQRREENKRPDICGFSNWAWVQLLEMGKDDYD